MLILPNVNESCRDMINLQRNKKNIISMNKQDFEEGKQRRRRMMMNSIF